MPTTLISTIHKGDAVEIAVYKFSPDKLILLDSKTADPTKKAGIERIKSKFKRIDVAVEKIEIYNIPEIVARVCQLIDDEAKLGNEIIIHISESRKTQSIASMFAGFIKKDKIKGIYYIEEETADLVPMPLLDFKLNNTKTAILKAIKAGSKTPRQILKKVSKSTAMVYAHIKDLKKDGYIKEGEELALTPSGEICALQPQ
ncbi:MAG: CRISPR-associated CARF protein Csa3 [Candidatus Woesearchaeota archaeon]|nr:CRISPR-associated CARF protein Csa3 [Candidatus Woesearchaeota archaeon]